ncbi:MAG: glycosyltransferase family 2 protein [Alkalispirochaeta sp.]
MSSSRVVSVIIPVYNRERLVGDALESVLSQTVPPGWELELVVVDDGSTDRTLEAVERGVGPSRSRGGAVSVLSVPHNGFPGAVRNRGVEASSGEVLAFLDSDDRWYPEKLCTQLPLHEAERCHISHTREVWLRNDRVVSQRKQKHHALPIPAALSGHVEATFYLWSLSCVHLGLRCNFALNSHSLPRSRTKKGLMITKANFKYCYSA